MEALGYATFAVADHFAVQYAPMQLLQYAADHTSRIRLATLVLDNDFRHPTVLGQGGGRPRSTERRLPRTRAGCRLAPPGVPSGRPPLGGSSPTRRLFGATDTSLTTARSAINDRVR